MSEQSFNTDGKRMDGDEVATGDDDVLADEVRSGAVDAADVDDEFPSTDDGEVVGAADANEDAKRAGADSTEGA